MRWPKGHLTPETQICGEKAFHHRLHKTKDRWAGRKCGQDL